jgi:hypothetical protein
MKEKAGNNMTVVGYRLPDIGHNKKREAKKNG